MLRSKHIAGNRDGVAGAVATIFILLIVLSFINIYIGAYVPSYMRTQEYNHMQDVYQQFSTFQLQNYNLESGHWQYPLATTFVMGAQGEAPFATPTNGQIMFSHSSFSVSIKLNYSLNSATNITQYDSAGGSLSLSVQNRYFTPQTVTYQGGAVIVTQNGVSFISSGPQFKALYSGGTTKTATVALNMISLLGNNFSLSGSGPASLSTSYFSNRSVYLTPPNGTTLNVTINTQLPMALAWEKYLSSSLSQFRNVTGLGSLYQKAGAYSLTLNLKGNTAYLNITIYKITSLHLRLGVMQTSGS